ncbi:FhaA domain-containing protein [Actinacidiphila glaucinigra]|uniref:FhaA domain-containing protein n=1 Tax=Actinacidiphila glaucinigra TaxID=235986 RepID=UPI0036E9E25C
MRFLRASERLMERWATNVRCYLLPTKPKPGEVVAILLRQCDDNALIFGRQHIVVPNAFVIELPPDIHRLLCENPLPVAPVLVHQVYRHAAEQGYTFAGPVAVHLRPAPGDTPARFRVHSRISPARERP